MGDINGNLYKVQASTGAVLHTFATNLQVAQNLWSDGASVWFTGLRSNNVARLQIKTSAISYAHVTSNQPLGIMTINRMVWVANDGPSVGTVTTLPKDLRMSELHKEILADSQAGRHTRRSGVRRDRRDTPWIANLENAISDASARAVYCGSSGKECGSRASARRFMPSSVRVTSQVPISRSSSAKRARFRAISCSMSWATSGLSATRCRI